MWFFDTPGTPGGASIVERFSLSSNDYRVSENPNFNLFTQYLFERKKVSFDDFFMTTWEQENESEGKK